MGYPAVAKTKNYPKEAIEMAAHILLDNTTGI